MPAGLVPANLNPAHVCYFKNPGVWWMSTDIISTCSPLQLLRYTCVSMGGGGWDGGSKGRGYVCILMADLRCCMAETNTTS